MGIFVHNKYDKLSMLLHWLVAVLVIFMLWYGHDIHHLPKGSMERLVAYQLHFSLGIVILGLMIIRLVWRLFHKAPPLVSSMATLEKVLAKTVHYLFYLALIIMPLSGWATQTTSPLKIPIMFFDLFQFPWFPGLYNLETPKIVHEVFQDMHITSSWVILGLVSLHILAVLYHTVIRKDGTLQRMLPKK